MVFPILIPTLIAKPISAFNARALATLVTVAGGTLYKRLHDILEALISTLETELVDDLRGDIDEAVRALLGSISDDDGLHVLMMVLLGWFVIRDYFVHSLISSLGPRILCPLVVYLR